MQKTTKIDIFSGFLGAGKTTLIKKLIREAFQGEQIVLIENEFGEIGIDGGFLQEAGIQINELNSGCICCSLVGDFREALRKVVEQYAPDRILIEPSGVGKLSDVTRAVQGVAEELPVQLNSFVTVADVKKVKMYMKNFGEFYNDQISHASCIILSRTGSADEEKVAAAVAMLKEKNPTATIVTTDWEQLNGKQILSVMDGKRDLVAELLAEAVKANEAHADEDEHEHHHHHHDHDEHDHEHGEHCCCHDHDHDHDEHDHEHEHDTMSTSMSIITSTASTAIVAMTMTTSITIITMSTAFAAAAIITTMMPTKCLPAGAPKPPASTPALSWNLLWAHWMAATTAPFCAARALWPVKAPGMNLTWCPASGRSASAVPM